MERNDMTNEVENMGMTDKQYYSNLESILAFAEETRDIDKVIALIKRMQGKEKEPTSGTK